WWWGVRGGGVGRALGVGSVWGNRGGSADRTAAVTPPRSPGLQGHTTRRGPGRLHAPVRRPVRASGRVNPGSQPQDHPGDRNDLLLGGFRSILSPGTTRRTGRSTRGTPPGAGGLSSGAADLLRRQGALAPAAG